MKKQGFEAVESEIRKEKAEALGRAGERLECALQALESFRRELLVLIANRPDDPLNVDRQYPVPAPLTPSMLTRGRDVRCRFA